MRVPIDGWTWHLFLVGSSSLGASSRRLLEGPAVGGVAGRGMDGGCGRSGRSASLLDLCLK
jgi:hypothetical protein